jgi:hypothetical protein
LAFRAPQQWYAYGGGSIGEVQSLTYQGENPRSDLNFVFGNNLVGDIVLRVETIFRVKT